MVPLLLETGGYATLLDRVLAVDCDESRQVARVVAGSGLDEQEIRRIMRAQLPREKRIAAADDVLSNDADIETLRARVRALHEQYLAAAGAAR